MSTMFDLDAFKKERDEKRKAGVGWNVTASDIISAYAAGELDLRGAYLREAYLRGAYLREAYLSEANLSGADLREAYLSGAYLSGADLREAYLRGADLREANLSGADLRGAYLSRAVLSGAYLSRADLRGAYLREAYLRGANLREAYLSGADLRGADLYGANLSGANLSGADLRGAYLSEANLRGANLSETCLSPLATMPVSPINQYFTVVNGTFLAYRTEQSVFVGSQRYEVTQHYEAPFFSVDTDTECHPGLYFDMLEKVQKLATEKNMRVIEVRVRVEDALKAGDKWRCKAFYVVRIVEKETTE